MTLNYQVAPLGVAAILQQQRQKTKVVSLKRESVFPCDGPEGTGDSQTNGLWLQYDKNRCPSSEADWQKQRFIHKENIGYLQWPK